MNETQRLKSKTSRMEWIEPVDVKSTVKFSSSLVNSSEEDSPSIVHGSISGMNNNL